jgi:hypothetical protein
MTSSNNLSTVEVAGRDRADLARRLRLAVVRLQNAGWLTVDDVDALLNRADVLARDSRRVVEVGDSIKGKESA